MTDPTALLLEPHHDGSALYVSDQRPALGDVVTVRLRVPHGGEPVDSVLVRVLRDAEPTYVPADVERTTDTDTWWRAELPVHNPVVSYRWVLGGGPSGHAWYNGDGVHHRDVPDAADFRLVAYPTAPPAWSDDAVVYQVFPDRFARSAAADERPTPGWALPAAWDDDVRLDMPYRATQLFGGDLDGIVEHLDHLTDLGVTVLYLTPVFPGRSNHRYDASTFSAVDPVLGGDDALARLTAACHARGIRVLGDLTTNHTGVSHEWFARAQADPASPERAFYYFGERARGDAARTDDLDVGVTDPAEDYVGWLGIRSLPKLDHASPELRRRLVEDPDGVVRRWLGAPWHLDGWRVDVANMTGRHGAADHYGRVQRDLRAAVDDATGGEGLLVAEHCHDLSQDVLGDGWHGAMNYSGFTRPVWTWLRDRDHAPRFLGTPLIVPRRGGAAVAATMREFASHLPWSVLTHSFDLVGSHDTTRIRTLVGGDTDVVEAAAALVLTMPGIPMITYGDEVGVTGVDGEDGRRPMPWGRDTWDDDLLARYRSLVAARRGSDALRTGGLRWAAATDDALVYLREGTASTALVHVARDAHEPVRLPARLLPGVAGGRSLHGPDVVLDGDDVVLAADRPGARVWQW